MKATLQPKLKNTKILMEEDTEYRLAKTCSWKIALTQLWAWQISTKNAQKVQKFAHKKQQFVQKYNKIVYKTPQK